MNIVLLAAVEGEEMLSPELVTGVIRAFIALVIALPLLFFATRALGRLLKKHTSPHTSMIASKAAFYVGVVVILLTVMREMGFELTAVLGAAGIMGVAIGFASQTSLSNIISGLFLVWEKPFQVGDIITVNGVTGAVHSIDLLSIKLRMFDNRFVRIPHETLIKNDVTNVTRFPIRRLDIQVGVAYKESVSRVIGVLKEVADRNPHCLDEPEPIVIFQNFGDSSLDFLFGVWCAKADFLVLRNSIMGEVKERFDQEGIEIPFPHRTLYTGSITEPFPVRILPETGNSEPDESGAPKE